MEQGPVGTTVMVFVLLSPGFPLSLVQGVVSLLDNVVNDPIGTEMLVVS